MSTLHAKNKLIKFELLSGKDDFYDIRVHCDVMVDKSLFIEEFLESNDGAALITRPRRSGKTLNLDMLKKFLAIEVDEHGNTIEPNPYYNLFAGGVVNSALSTKVLKPLAIAYANGGQYLKYQGKFPVIYINFAEVKGNSYEEVVECLRQKISTLYKSHEYFYKYLLAKGGFKAEFDAPKFKKAASGEVGEQGLKESILFLAKIMQEFYHKKVYVLVDEYDKPVNYLLENGLHAQNQMEIKKVTSLITSLLSHCGKNNNVVEKILMTGIYDSLLKEGNSGFNNLRSYGLLDSKYSRHFGFSQEEVNQAVSLLGFEHNQEQVIFENLRTWYNGYNVPINSTHNIAVYIPWAVMSYLGKAYAQQDFQPENYWPRTGSRAMLQNLIRLGSEDIDLRSKFPNITLSQEVKLDFDKDTSLFDMLQGNGKNEELFTYLLVNSGYLTARKDNDQYVFRIPNYEVEREFIKVIEIEINTNKNSELEPKLYLKKFFMALKADEEAKKISLSILKSNPEEFRSLISQSENSQLEICEYKGLNFFHMVSISGNCEIYNRLTELCNKELLSTKDQVHGLKPFDYALMLNRSNIIALMSKEKLESSVPIHPDFLTTLYCNDVISTGVSAVIIVSCKDYVKNFLTAIAVGAFPVSVGVKFAVTNSKTIKKYFDNHVCEQYDNYHEINQGSLIGFLKQITEDSNFYITTQPNCTLGDNNIYKLGVFETGEVNLAFSLCQSSQAEENRNYISDAHQIFYSALTAFTLLVPAALLGCMHINTPEIEW